MRPYNLAKAFSALEYICEREMVLFQQCLRLCFDQSCGKARNDGRDSPEELLIDDGNLRKIGDLGGTTNVSQCGQEVILDHRPEQHIWAEFLWRRFRKRIEVMRRKLFI